MICFFFVFKCQETDSKFGFFVVERYFRKGEMYGLAVFQILRSDNQLERRVRMKSVGILSDSFKFLKKYAPFLQDQVRKQLETHGSYEDLIELWETKNFSHIAVGKNQDINFSVPIKQKTSSNEVSLLNKIFSRKKVKF